MIRLGPKPTEPVLATPAPLELLVKSLAVKESASKTKSKDDDGIKLPDKDTFAGYKYSWLTEKQNLEMEKAYFMNNLIAGAQEAQDNGQDPLEYINAQQDDINAFNSYYLQRNNMLDSYWNKMVDDKKSAETIRAAITDPNQEYSGNDYAYEFSGERMKIKDRFPDVDEKYADLDLTLGHYLEGVESSRIRFDEEGKLVTNFRAIELPAMHKLWKIFDETYNGPGKDTVEDIHIQRLKDVDRLSGTTITSEGNKTVERSESQANKIDAFMSRARMQQPWEYNILMAEYKRANAGKKEFYMSQYDPNLHYTVAKSAEEYADLAIENDLRNDLMGMQDARQLQTYYQSTTYEGVETRDLQNALKDESKKITFTKLYNNDPNAVWNYGAFNTGVYRSRDAFMSNIDALPADIKGVMKNHYDQIFNILEEGVKKNSGMTLEDARNSYIESLKRSDSGEAKYNKFIRDEESAKKAIVIATDPYDGEINAIRSYMPEAYTSIVSQVKQKTEQKVNMKYYDYVPNSTFAAQFHNADLKGKPIYLIGGRRLDKNPYQLNLFAPAGGNIKIIQGLPNSEYDSRTDPKAIVYALVKKADLKEMKGVVNGKEYEYWENRDELGIKQLDELQKEYMLRYNPNLDIDYFNDYYITPLMIDAHMFLSHDVGKEN